MRTSPGKNKVLVFDFIGNFHNAYRIVEYLGLNPEEAIVPESLGRSHSSKQVVNLPLGCKVKFDDRVIDVFASQLLDPRKATRQNIAQILIYLYRRTSLRLKHPATAKEIDRMQVLHAGFYAMVFGSWEKFEALMQNEGPESLSRLSVHPPGMQPKRFARPITPRSCAAAASVLGASVRPDRVRQRRGSCLSATRAIELAFNRAHTAEIPIP